MEEPTVIYKSNGYAYGKYFYNLSAFSLIPASTIRIEIPMFLDNKGKAQMGVGYLLNPGKVLKIGEELYRTKRASISQHSEALVQVVRIDGEPIEQFDLENAYKKRTISVLNQMTEKEYLNNLARLGNEQLQCNTKCGKQDCKCNDTNRCSVPSL